MASNVVIGNTAYPTADGRWDWTFYVRPADLIDEVVVTLHPTFQDPVCSLRGPKLELSRNGWGTFALGVDIFWRGGIHSKETYNLRFDHRQADFHENVAVPAGVLPESHQHLAAPSSNLGPSQDANDRLAVMAVLEAAPSMDPGNDPSGQSWHGRLVQEQLPAPRMTWQSQQKPREDKHGKQDVPAWLNASEYKDDSQTLAYKVRLLAHLLRCSNKTLAYTGAGLSVAAGIEMAAAGSAQASRKSPLEADPTIAHCIMAELNQANLLHGWVQQNHDGLPQKAGYRQEDINEIHGSWYDPSNPVVLYSGSLRGDLFADMKTWADTADLVLVLGTSLSGLNADQCVRKAASRSLPRKSERQGSLGSVIISPQRTPEDGQATLRLFATADEVMTALAQEFNLQERLDPQRRRATFSSQLRVKVPYDRNGKRSDRVQTTWDLSPGASLRVSQHNNIKGAQQPAYLHITPKLIGEALPLNERTCCISIDFGESAMQLGIWWIDAALRGGVEYLPVYNVDAVEERIR